MKLLEYIESFIKLTINKTVIITLIMVKISVLICLILITMTFMVVVSGGGLPTNLLIESSTNHKSDNFNISSNCSNHQIYWNQ